MRIAAERGKLLGLFMEDSLPFILVDQLFLIFHVKDSMLGADEEMGINTGKVGISLVGIVEVFKGVTSCWDI